MAESTFVLNLNCSFTNITAADFSNTTEEFAYDFDDHNSDIESCNHDFDNHFDNHLNNQHTENDDSKDQEFQTELMIEIDNKKSLNTCIELENEVTSSYLDYAMSVIVSRALPDVRDGLKPVHRRILYAMEEAGYTAGKSFKKAARIVGDVLGKYHPHGDASIYDAMVRMAQSFAMTCPLIDGQGNWGSIDGDKAAASRYTEARLTRIAELLLKDYDNQAVDYELNYDGTLPVPCVLPAMFPNLLVNGANGIAVGMATSVPTHNLSEVINATCILIDNPHASISEILSVLPGPDFPTGGIIISLGDIEKTYRTGRGSIILRAKHHVEQLKDHREAIILTEIPYQINKSKMIEKIVELAQKKDIEGISDIRDESDRHGIRVVIELKRDINTDIILAQLFSLSQMEISVSFNMLALHNNRPQQMGVIQILQAFIDFRKEVIQRRTEYFLSKCQARIHVLSALLISIDHIDKIISIIRGSSNYAAALAGLLEQEWSITSDIKELIDVSEDVYRFDEKQAKAILDLRLHKLTKLEKTSLADETHAVMEQMREYIHILNSPERLFSVMKEELLNIQKTFGVERKTEISSAMRILNEDFWIQKEDMVVTISLNGYVKRVPLDTYRLQKRGGKGKTGVNLKDEDTVKQMFIANTHSYILFFSSTGRVYKEKVYKLPLATAQSRGKAIVNLLPLDVNENISTIMLIDKSDSIMQDQTVQENLFDKTQHELAKTSDLHSEDSTQYLIFATEKGYVRRNKIEDFENIRTNGKIAIKLDENDKLISVMLCSSNEDIMLTTKHGKSIRFSVEELRVFAGRDSSGVQGIKLLRGDVVVSMCILKSTTAEGDVSRSTTEGDVSRSIAEGDVSRSIAEGDVFNNNFQNEELTPQGQIILSISDHGFGKMTYENAYRRSLRRGQGVLSMKVKSHEFVVATFPVKPSDQVILSTNLGRLIRCKVSDIRISNRNTHGVTICRMNNQERIVSVACLECDDDDDDIQ